MEYEINQLFSKANYRLFECSKVKQFTNFQTRLQIVNAVVISKISYMLPLYSNCSRDQLNKLNKLIMKAARFAIGNYCFKRSISFILNACSFVSVNRMIVNSALKVIQKTIYTAQPRPIHNFFDIGTRKAAPISTKYAPGSKLLKQFYPYKYIHTYNSIPRNLKDVPCKKFKHNLKKGKVAVNLC